MRKYLGLELGLGAIFVWGNGPRTSVNTSMLILDWKWKLSWCIFIDVVSTLAKQLWNDVDRITSIQSDESRLFQRWNLVENESRADVCLSTLVRWSMHIWTKKKAILCPEISWVKIFLSFTRLHCRMCNRIYIFNLKTNKQTNKQNSNKTKTKKN